MERSVRPTDNLKYIVIAVGALLAVLLVVALWMAERDEGRLATTRGAGGEISLPIDEDQAEDIALAHTRGTVKDTDVIRDNGVISYLVMVDPEVDNGDGDARRLLFINPETKNVTRVERWSVDAQRDVLITEAEAETIALAPAGEGSRVMDSELQTYDGREVWQVKVDAGNAADRLITIDAESGEVLRSFELLRDY